MAGEHVRIRLGTWRAGGYPAGVMLAFLWYLIIELTMRASVYVIGLPDDDGRSMSVVEQSMSLVVWGAVLGYAALLLIVGQSVRSYWMIITGSVVAAATYATLAFGAVLAIGEGGSVRAAVDLAVFALIWSTISVGTANKRRRDDARIYAELRER